MLSTIKYKGDSLYLQSDQLCVVDVSYTVAAEELATMIIRMLLLTVNLMADVLAMLELHVNYMYYFVFIKFFFKQLLKQNHVYSSYS